MRVVTLLIAGLVLLLPGTSAAHHILGVPHYAYDERYPQTPVLTYRVEAGPWELRMTGYPGQVEPGDRATFHVYVTRLDGGAPFDGVVTMTVFEESLLGANEIVYGPMDAELDERVFKFHPRFENEATYLLRVHFQGEREPWTIDLPMAVGEPGSPWAVVATVGIATAAFLVIIRAVRIKRRRARPSVAEEASA